VREQCERERVGVGEGAHICHTSVRKIVPTRFQSSFFTDSKKDLQGLLHVGQVNEKKT